MTQSSTQLSAGERAILFAILGLGTMALLGIFIFLGGSTEGNHKLGDHYLPSGLFMATMLSLLCAFVLTLVSDAVFGKANWMFFPLGGVVGVAILLYTIVSGLGEHSYTSSPYFPTAMWWLPPMLGTAAYAAHGAYREFVA
ncbi:hypothetical protein [Rhodococcoides corynebacterioides]|uniref:hypothetical protein n=1 Tax=Rhodococcoides corynebacterioides TaxID=53972 RepID=UPI001C9B8FD3|nr:hypothetical protein [Rhodococcus corynebacterioides]MBY6349108.1 hypothetical protein [Rhodococcus corynebacterioides]